MGAGMKEFAELGAPARKMTAGGSAETRRPPHTPQARTRARDWAAAEVKSHMHGNVWASDGSTPIESKLLSMKGMT